MHWQSCSGTVDHPCVLPATIEQDRRRLVRAVPDRPTSPSPCGDRRAHMVLVQSLHSTPETECSSW